MKREMRRWMVGAVMALGCVIWAAVAVAGTVIGGQVPSGTDVSWDYTVTSAVATTKQIVSGAYTHWSVQLQKNDAAAIVTQVRVYLSGQVVSTTVGSVTTDGDFYQWDGPIYAFDLNTTTCDVGCDARIVVTATR
jgi:hypothetical protein